MQINLVNQDRNRDSGVHCHKVRGIKASKSHGKQQLNSYSNQPAKFCVYQIVFFMLQNATAGLLLAVFAVLVLEPFWQAQRLYLCLYSVLLSESFMCQFQFYVCAIFLH